MASSISSSESVASAPVSDATSSAPPLTSTPTLTDYFRVVGFLALFGGLLAFVAARGRDVAADPRTLLGPMFALVALTALVWLLMVVVRNALILRGLVSAKYFVDYQSHAPAEWSERPARTFNNLMQVPPLFYVVCLAMLITGELDSAQVSLAWVFVAARALHAIVYIGWNRLPSRFASWIAGCMTLGVIWTRFAIQAWPY